MPLLNQHISYHLAQTQYGFAMRTSENLEISNAFYELNIRNAREPREEGNQELTCKIFLKEQTDSKF